MPDCLNKFTAAEFENEGCETEFRIGSYVWLKPEYTGRSKPLKVRVTHALSGGQQHGKAIETGGATWVFSAEDTL